MIPVALIGLMGAGKSTVGALVADRTGRRLVDVDRVIEQRTHKTVRELWEDGGEAAYRRMESDECVAALEAGDVVLATPGGAVLDPAVRAALRGCRVVWLRAEPTVLARRVAVGDHRPLLGSEPGPVLTRMDADRSGLYAAAAGLTIRTDECTPEAAADEIVDWLVATGVTRDIRRIDT